MSKCSICDKTASGDGVTLHRINELGQVGIWRCSDHLSEAQKSAIDPEVADIVRAIEEDRQKPPQPADEREG